MSFACLPMYDLPEVRGATDALWSGIARHLRAQGLHDIPDALERSRSIEDQWRDPELLLGQACGYPVTHDFADSLVVVATPSHRVPGCEGGRYHSVVVVPADAPFRDLAELRGETAVINERHSHSGMNALGAAVAPFVETKEQRFFGRVLLSGSHVNSLAMVADKRASVAAIDCVTHALLARWRPSALVGTRILTKTASAPALPFVTARTTPDETTDDFIGRLRDGLAGAMRDAALANARADLLLSGVTVLPDDAYDVIKAIQRTHALAEQV